MAITPTNNDPAVAMQARIDAGRQAEQKRADIVNQSKQNQAVRAEHQQAAVRQVEERQEAAKNSVNTVA